MTSDEFDAVIRVHLKGHFNFISQACSYWRQKAKAGDDIYGRLISTTSEAFLYGSVGQPNYAAAKAGIVQLTLVAAQTMVKYGVTANAVAMMRKIIGMGFHLRNSASRRHTMGNRVIGTRCVGMLSNCGSILMKRVAITQMIPRRSTIAVSDRFTANTGPVIPGTVSGDWHRYRRV